MNIFQQKGARMNKRLLFVVIATMVTTGVMSARTKSNMVRIDSNKGFMFWGKEPVITTAVYAKGDQEKVTRGVQQKSEFIFNHPKHGELLRLEIQNQQDVKPTIIEPKRGMEYKLKFDKDSGMWFVEKTKSI
jgi:hypothetical protein